jgi:hypothetical protein
MLIYVWWDTNGLAEFVGIIRILFYILMDSVTQSRIWFSYFSSSLIAPQWFCWPKSVGEAARPVDIRRELVYYPSSSVLRTDFVWEHRLSLYNARSRRKSSVLEHPAADRIVLWFKPGRPRVSLTCVQVCNVYRWKTGH